MDLRSAAIACVLLAAATAAAAATRPRPPPTFPADVAALVAVAASNPSFNASWVGDPCGDAWRGVSCDDSSRVVRLDLFSNALTGAIPPELGGLASLQHLVLSFNALTGTIPAQLGGLANLTYLDLHRNALAGAIPPELGALASLEIMSLSSNALTGAIPPKLRGLVNLTELDLHDNALTGAIPKELGGLATLKRLDLSSNNLTGPIPKELGNVTCRINLGCMVLSSADAAFVCTEWGCKSAGPCLDDTCNICSFPSPRGTVLVVWITWCGIGLLVLTATLVVSQCYPAAHTSPNSKTVITLIGIGKYLWGWLSLSFILFDVVTNFHILGALLGSWSLYAVALLIVLQHVVSGVVLYACSVRKGAWPIASGLRGLCIKWKWDWRRCMIGFQGERILAGDGKGIRRAHLLHVLLWPLDLIYVALLDILSLLALKVGLQCKVGSDWVNLEPYWASRELSDALLQALPQAIFQSVLLLTRADPAASKIFITRRQFVLSVSSSLGSVVVVLAMVLWEARAKGETINTRMWHQFFGLLPRIME